LRIPPGPLGHKAPELVRSGAEHCLATAHPRAEANFFLVALSTSNVGERSIPVGDIGWVSEERCLLERRLCLTVDAALSNLALLGVLVADPWISVWCSFVLIPSTEALGVARSEAVNSGQGITPWKEKNLPPFAVRLLTSEAI
jgi:hypothetical protein